MTWVYDTGRHARPFYPLNMVVKIQKSAGSCSAPIGYNERKVAMGEAEVLSWNGIDSPTPAGIYGTFEAYESNPAISAKTGNLAFHMTVNPSIMDGMTDEKASEFIKDLMDGLGYGEQPWVAYKHMDIDRVHYHVVSVRVDKKGKVISDSFQRRNLQSLMERLAPKYGFQIGKGEPRTPERAASRTVERKRVASIVRSCFAYSTSELHFQRMLEKKGIGLRLFRTKEGRLYGALFDNRKSGITFKCSELSGINIAMMRDALESGKWANPCKEKDHRESTGIHESHHQAENDRATEQEAANELSSVLTGGEADKSKEQDIRKKKKRKGITI